MSKSETTAEADVHPMTAFAQRWRFYGVGLQCRLCHRTQQVSASLDPIQHSHWCDGGGEANPWITLHSLIGAEIARVGNERISVKFEELIANGT